MTPIALALICAIPTAPFVVQPTPHKQTLAPVTQSCPRFRPEPSRQHTLLLLGGRIVLDTTDPVWRRA